jgi:mono/diheme cytochrome c family protein
MNGRISSGVRSLLWAGLVTGLGACSWFTDFKEQPKIDPWETAGDSVPMRGNPQNSVSVYGSAAPGFAVSRMALPATLDSMSGIANPVPADARSLHNGRMYYQINCAVCHGEAGKGDGPVLATKQLFPPPLVGASAEGRSDGYIWGIMRNGRGAMPSYNRIEELDRWDVVNYVRGLQGRYQVAVGPVGLPGETGDKVPGYSQMGPTRPSPYYIRAGSQAGPSRGLLATPVQGAPSTSPMPGEPGTAAPSAQRPDSTATVPPVTSQPTQPARPTTPTTTPTTGGHR